MERELQLKPYITVSTPARSEITVQKSRFIADCLPVHSEQEVGEKLAEIRSAFWDASHHCYAYSIGPGGEFSRFSDDGEPSSTAGMPMMEAIRYAGVTDVLCVVTRYFGGILLGTGGLVKAYSQACRSALEAAAKIRMAPAAVYAYSVPYPLYGTFSRISEQYAETDETSFGENVFCRIHISTEKEQRFLNELRERTNGKLTGKREKECFFPFSV